jgi:hypothetical protein
MKYTLFLLAAMVGTVLGTHIQAEIFGVTTIGEPCSEAVDQFLFKECVEDEATKLGIDFTARRLELRGDRELSYCSACPSGYYPRGHWCFTRCGGRRLSVDDESAHDTERRLCSQGKLKYEALQCLVDKLEGGGYECLGNSDDLKIKIFLSS